MTEQAQRNDSHADDTPYLIALLAYFWASP